jgi:hypothetical protein
LDLRPHRWPARYLPFGLIVTLLVTFVGSALFRSFLRELFWGLDVLARVPLGFVLVGAWGMLAVATANLPRFLRHKAKPTWQIDPSLDQVTITNAFGGVRAFPFSDLDRFSLEDGAIKGQMGAVAASAVYGDANGERVLLGWFADEARAVKLQDVLSEALVANEAAYAWNRKQRDV